MNGYLIDTSVALLALSEPERLTPKVRAAILAGPNLLSVASYWEVILKSMKGKLQVGDPRVWWSDALDQLAATALPLRPDHVAGLCELAGHHQHPFGRVLISQATTDHLTLVTMDGAIAAYASSRFRALY